MNDFNDSAILLINRLYRAISLLRSTVTRHFKCHFSNMLQEREGVADQWYFRIFSKRNIHIFLTHWLVPIKSDRSDDWKCGGELRCNIHDDDCCAEGKENKVDQQSESSPRLISPVAFQRTVDSTNPVRNVELTNLPTCLVSGVAEHQPKKRFACRVCGKAFSHKQSLTRHGRQECVVVEPRYACPYCRTRSKYATAIYRHVRRIHLGFEVKTNLLYWTCSFRWTSTLKEPPPISRRPCLFQSKKIAIPSFSFE